MRNRWLIYILLFCLFYLGVSSFTNIRSYRALPEAELVLRNQELKVMLDAIKRTHGGVPSDAKNRKDYYQLIIQKGQIMSEIVIRRSYLDNLMALLLTLTIVLMITLKLKTRQSAIASNQAEVVRDMQVMVDPPREEYLDEWALPQRSADGFASKEEASQFLKNDPSLSCDYCGGVLRSSFTGKREAVELVTFYKNVPPGAKDLRMVLGSYWFPKPATQLNCSKCGREVHR